MEIRAIHWTMALVFSAVIHILIVHFIYATAGTGTKGSQGVSVRLSTSTAPVAALEVSSKTRDTSSIPAASPVDVEPAAAAASLTEIGREEIDTATSLVPPREVVRSRPGILDQVSADTVPEVKPQDFAAAENTVTAATAVAGNEEGYSPNAGQSDTADSGGSGTADDYYTEIAIWLGRHKRYPRRARRGGQEGTVEVEFVIDKSGRLQRRRIVTSSGFELLDEEAHALIGRAAPMPPIPEEMDTDALTITAPISFSLR